MRKKLTYEFIKEQIEKENYTLLSTIYISAKSKIKCRCPNGHEYVTCWDKFRSGQKCPKCYKLTWPTIEKVRTAFENENYILLSDKYVNSKSKLNFICSEGHLGTITWSNFRNGYRCHACGILSKKGSNNTNWKGGVRKLNLPLYNTYAPQLEKYHTTSKIIQDNLELLGVECTFCKKIYVPTTKNVDSRLLVLNGRHGGSSNFYCSEGCKEACPIFAQILWPKDKKPYKEPRQLQSQWANMVKERDNNTCQKCGAKNKVMYAHHIDPVINNPIESADIDNGITLCKKCDKLAHQTVGCSYSELRC